MKGKGPAKATSDFFHKPAIKAFEVLSNAIPSRHKNITHCGRKNRDLIIQSWQQVSSENGRDLVPVVGKGELVGGPLNG